MTVHEIGHDILPHQRKLFQILEESEVEIDPDTKELFEQEANCFASEVLFQREKFTTEAADFPLGIKVPLDLSKKYGPSVYAAARRYVARDICRALWSYSKCPYAWMANGRRWNCGGSLRPHCSGNNSVRFGGHSGVTRRVSSCGTVRRGSFLDRDRCGIHDRNGEAQTCLAEAFNTTHNVLFLVYPAIFGAVADII